MLARSRSDVVSVTIEHPDVEPLDDVVVRYQPPGLRLSLELFDADFRQVKAAGKPDDVLDSADLINPDSWLATKRLHTPFLKRVADRWREFRADRTRACLTLATTRHWQRDDPIGAHFLDSDFRVSPRVFSDRKAQALLRAWQECAELTFEEFPTFVTSLRFETKTPAIQQLADDVAQLADVLRIEPVRDVAAIVEMFRRIFRSERRELDRDTLASLLSVRIGMLVESIRVTKTRPLRAYCGPSQAMPVDVGAVWGFQNGGFAGIIHGASPSDVSETLRGASELLQEVRSGFGRAWRQVEGFHGQAAMDDLLSRLGNTEAHGLVVSPTDVQPETLRTLRELAVRLREAGHAIVIVAAPAVAEPVRAALAHAQIECELLRVPPGQLPDAAADGAQSLSLLKTSKRDELLALSATKIATLLAHAAGHNAVAVRHAALALASSSDAWLDRWLDLQMLESTDLLTACSNPDPRFDSYVDDVALALIRLTKRAPSRQAEVLAGLAELERIASESVCNAVRVWSDGRLSTFQQAPPGVQLLLLRAGLDADLLWPSPVHDHRVVQCVPPSAARLESLLARPAAERAAVGLCTADEWLAILDDPDTCETVIDRRYSRPLPHIRPYRDLR